MLNTLTLCFDVISVISKVTWLTDWQIFTTFDWLFISDTAVLLGSINSILFISEERKWWKIKKVNVKNNGCEVECVVSDFAPSFAWLVYI